MEFGIDLRNKLETSKEIYLYLMQTKITLFHSHIPKSVTLALQLMITKRKPLFSYIVEGKN